MDSEKQIEWIEQYLDGLISGDQLVAFEQKMATDPLFANEVQLQREIAEAMNESDVIELSQKIRSIQHQKKQQPSGSGRIIIFRRLLQIAAGLALLVAVYFVNENFNKTHTPQELAAQYFSPDENVSHSLIDGERSVDPDSTIQATNGLSTKIDATWKEIETLYNQKGYQQALKKLEEIQSIDPSFNIQFGAEFYYYQGLFQMLNDNPGLAVNTFQKVKTTYTEKATWYSALCYLELDDVGNTNKLLKQILSNGFHPYKEPAQQLLNELDKLN